MSETWEILQEGTGLTVEEGDNVEVSFSLKMIGTDAILAETPPDSPQKYTVTDPSEWWFNLIGQKEGAEVHFKSDGEANVADDG